MIILITGASHTGKTLLAQRMLERFGYPYLSIDHLKMGLIRSGNTHLTPDDDDALTDYLWPIVLEIIKTAIENQQNLIVEGCYIPSNWRQDFSKQYLSSIRFICLAMTDAHIDAHIDDIKKHSSDIETRLYDTNYTPDSLKADNLVFIQSFTKSGEHVTLINEDYVETINALVEQYVPILSERMLHSSQNPPDYPRNLVECANICNFAPRTIEGDIKDSDETGNQSPGKYSCECIQHVDFITHADGDTSEDIGCKPSGEDQQTNGYQV